MKKVLWLTSWYPNETDPFSGDFIKRQAEAVSIYQSLIVLWVGKYAPINFSNRTNYTNSELKTENLKEYILYYPSPGESNNIFSKFKSLLNYFKKNREFIQQLRKKNELPDLVHVQVAMKAGLIALYMKWKYKIPYVLTEHWSGYFSVAKDSLFKKSFLTRFLTRIILKNATVVLPVSTSLGNQIDQFWAHVPFQKIPNVVDTLLFYPALAKTTHAFRFIHISSLAYPKNPEGIINSFIHMLHLHFDVELVLVGPLNSSVNKLLSAEVMSAGRIRTTGEISYEEVGKELRNADALIMFSYYENMPCVILEALCTGIPVIASDVGGIREVVNTDNGILVEAGKENQLIEAMKQMISNYKLFEKDLISKQAKEQFSYQIIGKKILQIYNDVLGNNHR
ncbi:MAG TPA: glycosyltransferase [Puia sp.]|nr:glycosyltransferase [Puia sp.]